MRKIRIDDRKDVAYVSDPALFLSPHFRPMNAFRKNTH